LLEWYQKQLKDLGVEVRLGSQVSAELIRQETPDIVFIASGSKPLVPEIAGIDSPSVITSVDLLLGKKKSGQTAVVIGGGLTGCETALWLAKQGKNVTIVEMLPGLMSGGLPIPHMNKLMVLDLLAFHHVKIMTCTRVEEIGEGCVIVTGENSLKQSLPADTVVLSIGLVPDNELFKQLDGRFARAYQIGDCREPRNIMGAIWDAYEVARSI
jgi:2-enoate reductase